MILHAIELTNVGRFRDTVRLGPFAPGLNILSAPNESGKTTALHATARALFDRHTTKSDELKSLQPAGTDLTPRIAVEFETASGRYRIEKTFLQTPTSHLRRWRSDTSAWEPIAEADAADQRVQDLLQTTLPGRGATKPEHWGLLGFLWARQGEPATWPGLADENTGQRIRARLARIELDPAIEKLRARFADTADAIITNNGKPKTTGPLAIAEADLATLETALAALRQTRADLETAHQRYQQADTDVARLEKEQTECAAAETALRKQALAAEHLRNELESRQQALTHAQEKLTAIAADAETLARRRNELTTTQTALRQTQTDHQAATQTHATLHAHLNTAQQERPTHEAKLEALRTRYQRLQSLQKLRDLTAAAAALNKQLAKATAIAAEIAALETKKNKLPALTPAKLRKLEDLAENIRTLRAQVQALGLTIELTPEHAAKIHLTAPAAETKSASRPINIAANSPHLLQSPIHSTCTSPAGDASTFAPVRKTPKTPLPNSPTLKTPCAKT